MDLAMSEAEREEFLAEPHVGVLGVTDSRKASAPLLLPIWYCYLPDSSLPNPYLPYSSAHRGEIVVETARTSVKTELLRSAGRFSLCAQTETEPYRYVSVEGPIAAIDDPVDPDVRAAMARRYLEPETAEAYLASNGGQLTDDVLFRMRPQHWRTADFAAFARSFS